jgi:Family of unknown function (DUF5397)
MDSSLDRASEKKFRRFGPVGPAYEIVGVLRDLPDGDKMLRIRVLESGEEVEYRLSNAIEDPEAD